MIRSMSIPMDEILRMSAAERILLVQDMWDSIAAAPEGIGLTDAERAELDRRLADDHADSAAGSPWEDVRRRILATRRAG
jgi:putative addiction module component (TIGR02574 family)